LGGFEVEALYTVDLIIDTVQAKILRSQTFREQITDWLKGQVGNWNKSYEKVPELISKIQSIIDEKVEVELPIESQQFKRLIDHLRVQKVEWPIENKWDEFITELLVLPAAKSWFQTEFSSCHAIQLAQKKNSIKEKFQQGYLGSEDVEKLKKTIIENKPLSLEAIAEKASQQKKIEQIRTILPLQPDTISRLLKGDGNLEMAIKDRLDLTRQVDFLNQLQLEDMSQKGISSGVLEWIVVSQQILMPQEVE
jgi:hypothetical protein